MEINPQTIIDEMLKKINALTAENIVLNSQVKTLTEVIEKYKEASPSTVMADTVGSEGKYEKAIEEGLIGPGA